MDVLLPLAGYTLDSPLLSTSFCVPLFKLLSNFPLTPLPPFQGVYYSIHNFISDEEYCSKINMPPGIEGKTFIVQVSLHVPIVCTMYMQARANSSFLRGLVMWDSIPVTTCVIVEPSWLG